jgi:hypothetical protein
MTCFHLVQWNDSRSLFEIVGHYDTKEQARQALARIKAHFNYAGQDIELIGDYSLGYLTALQGG